MCTLNSLQVIFFFQEKELLKKKQEEIEEAERAKRNKVVVTFDLVGRKVLNALKKWTVLYFVISWICCCMNIYSASWILH